MSETRSVFLKNFSLLFTSQIRLIFKLILDKLPGSRALTLSTITFCVYLVAHEIVVVLLVVHVHFENRADHFLHFVFDIRVHEFHVRAKRVRESREDRGHRVLERERVHVRVEDLLGRFPESDHDRVRAERFPKELVEERGEGSRARSEQRDVEVGSARDRLARDRKTHSLAGHDELVVSRPARPEGHLVAKQIEHVDDVEVPGSGHMKKVRAPGLGQDAKFRVHQGTRPLVVANEEMSHAFRDGVEIGRSQLTKEARQLGPGRHAPDLFETKVVHDALLEEVHIIVIVIA